MTIFTKFIQKEPVYLYFYYRNKQIDLRKIYIQVSQD